MTFNPTAHPDCLYYVPNFLDEPGDYHVANDGTGVGPVNVGDYFGSVETDVNGVILAASSDARKLQLAAGGGIQGGNLGGNNRGFRHAGLKSYHKQFHASGRFFAIVVARMDAGISQSSRPIWDNCDFQTSGTDRQGITIASQAVSATNTSHFKGRINTATSTPALEIVSDEPINDEQQHLLMFNADPASPSWIRAGRGARKFRQQSGSLSTADPYQDLWFLNRASTASPYQGIVYCAAIYSQYPGDAEVQTWIDKFGYGPIAGSPGLYLGDSHFHLNTAFAYCPFRWWYKGFRTFGRDDDQNGAVFTIDGSWRGGPHGFESVQTSKVWVDGVEETVADGDEYRGSRIKFERTTNLFTTFLHRQTVEWIDEATRIDKLWFHRIDDGKTVTVSYPGRYSRGVGYTGVAGFTANGTLIGELSLASADGSTSFLNGSAGHVAIAQFNPTDGVMFLLALRVGSGYSYRFIFTDGTEDKRCYLQLLDGDINPSPGTIQSFELVEKLYETTAEEWKGLAASEVPKLLSQPLLMAVHNGDLR